MAACYFRICNLSKSGLMRIPMKVNSERGMRGLALLVLSILMTNPDGMAITVWGEIFNTSGIAEIAYVPPFKSTPATRSPGPP